MQSVVLPKGKMEGCLLIRVRASRWDWNLTELLRGRIEAVTLLHDLFLKSRHISALHFQCWLFFFFTAYERSAWYFISTDMLNKNRYRNFALMLTYSDTYSLYPPYTAFSDYFTTWYCSDLIFMREGGIYFPAVLAYVK